jgi:hypothetical protein
MVKDFKGHLINPAEVAYISPISRFDDPFIYRKGYRFSVSLKNGQTFAIESDEFVETLEERKAFLKNWRKYINELTAVRDDLIRSVNNG